MLFDQADIDAVYDTVTTVQTALLHYLKAAA